MSADAFAVAVARFYGQIAERLLAGASGAFESCGATIEVHDVPGAYELPLAAKYLAESGRYAGVACLGAVVRGETDHYDYVCAEAAHGISRVSLDTGVPCSFGVLTVDTLEQALERSSGERNHGEHAARVVLTMAALRQSVGPAGAGAATTSTTGGRAAASF